MSETKTTTKPAAASAPAGKFSKSATAQDEKRAKASHRLFVRLLICLAAAVGVYTALTTGDLSIRLALLLAGAVLAAAAFYAGVWVQFMWPKEV